MWPEHNVGTSQVLSGKESTCQTGDAGSIPGSGRSPGEGNGHLLQYSCREKPQEPRRLAGCSPWGCKELHTSELTQAPSTTCHVCSSAFFLLQHSVVLDLWAEVPLGVQKEVSKDALSVVPGRFHVTLRAVICVLLLADIPLPGTVFGGVLSFSFCFVKAPVSVSSRSPLFSLQPCGLFP